MRNLITDYTIDAENRTITLSKFANLAESNPFTIENIRLIVNETKQQVICSSMQKNNVSVEGNVIKLEKAELGLDNNDQLTIEVDMGDGITYVDSGDWVINAKLDALKPIDQQKEWVLDEAKARQLKPIVEGNASDEVLGFGIASFFKNSLCKIADLSSWEKLSGNYVGYKSFSMSRSLQSVDLSSLLEISQNFSANFMFESCFSLTEVNLSKLKSINGTNAAQGMFQNCSSLKFVDLSGLETINGSIYAASGIFSSCVSLIKVDLRNLTSVTGSAALEGAFSKCPVLQSVDLRSLQHYSGNANTVGNMFQNSPVKEIRIHCLGVHDSMSPLVTATDLTDLYLYGDASNNIYLSWQGSLNFNSVCGVLRKLCDNTDASGLICSFKSGFTMTDQTSHIYTDGDGNTTEYNEPNGILATLKAQAESQGWTIQNLTIK